MFDKKKLIISSVTIVIAAIIAIIIYLNNRIVLDNSGFTTINDLNIEVYSKAKISDLIDSIEGKVLEDKEINTEKLGTQELSFLYQNENNKKRLGTININVVDKEEPLVWLSNSYSIKKGSEDNIAESILCVDNYDSNPTCKIEGTYDLNTVGAYDLTYVATDNSNNQSTIDFTLNVYEPAPSNSNNNNNQATPSGTYFQDVLNMHLDENTKIGIDISKWQGDVDFEKVKNAGAEFVMIRIGSQNGVSGEYTLDPYFKQNIENAKANGLDVGIYFYSYADSNEEAEKQAKWIVENLKDYDITLPIAFDFECYSSFNHMNLSLYELNEMAESFFKVLEENNYDVVLYGSKNYLNAIWKYNTKDVWLAHYTNQTDYDKEYIMWQMCQNGIIDGIDGYVDIDIMYKK